MQLQDLDRADFLNLNFHRYVLASSPLSGALSPNKHNKAKNRTNITGALKEYSSLLGVIWEFNF